MMEEKPRIVFLNGSVTSASAMSVIVQLLYLENEDDTKEIQLYINSPGGSIDYGLAIYDTMRHIKAPVSTVCYGMAASMGAFLLSCGAKGRRFALPHSRILIHQPLVYFDGMPEEYGQTDLQRLADSLTESREELETIIASNAGKSVQVVHADCERDNWMSAEEAKEYGLIDSIIGV